MTEENDFPDYYATLNVKDGAPSAQIKNAFRREISYWHPDKWMDAPQEAKERAQVMTVKVNEAYETLGNLEKRTAYDQYYSEWKSLDISGNPPGEDPEEPPTKSALEEMLIQKGLEIIDKRPQGGTLWVAGGAELASFFKELQAHGFNFVFMSRGGRAVKHRPSWYLKN